MSFRVLVCGSRTYNDEELIRSVMSSLPEGTIVIQGEARGADLIARMVAEELGFEVLGFPADWGTHGKAAGPIRNKQMLEEGKPDLVLAFFKDKADSPGTRNMVSQARKFGCTVVEYGGEQESSTLNTRR